MNGRLVLRAANLVDGTGAPPVRNAELIIERDRIARTGPAGAIHNDVPGDRVVDYGTATLLPGLIDTHVHLQFNASPTSEEVAAVHMTESAAQLIDRSVTNGAIALGAGVTTMRDCGGHLEPAMSVREKLELGDTIAPRVLHSGAPITTGGGHLHWCGLIADSAEEATSAVRRLLDAGADFIKVMASGGGMTPASDQRRPQYSHADLARIVDLAHGLRRHVAAHTLAAEGCEIAIDVGVDTFEHFFWQTDSGFDYRSQAVSRINPATQTINATYSGWDRNNLASFEHIDDVPESNILTLRNKYWFYRDAADKGVMVTSSSDAGVRQTPFDGFALSVIAGMVAMEDNPVGAIHRATLAQSRAIRMECEIGSLEPGKLADVLVVEGDASDNLFALRQPLAVYLGGQEVDLTSLPGKNGGRDDSDGR